jgi:protein-L-isoaspartate(D-aspartate) O-methyltransferase
MEAMTDFASARTAMVNSQVRTEDVTDYALLAAMAEVPRELFVPDRMRPFAYIDSDLAISDDLPPRYLMAPAPFARLVQLAEIDGTSLVLDIGCGTGYSAAVLARFARSVVAVESDPALAGRAASSLGALGVANAEVVIGSLEVGYPSAGPYDAIILEGAVEFVPKALLRQLKLGGMLVAVIGYGRSSPATVYTRTQDDFGDRPAFDAYVKRLPGFERPKTFIF